MESPWRGDMSRDHKYLLACLRDCITRGEAPFASHLFYTQFMNDDDPTERALGIEMGLNWGRAADITAVYTDHGVSEGMLIGIHAAHGVGRRVEYRKLYAT